MRKILASISCVFMLVSCVGTTNLSAQESMSSQKPNGYWQQHVDYIMEIDMDVKSNTYKGIQKLVYTNNSPDTLNRVFYHLYFNAFQPGSEMDVRARSIADPDPRIGDRIVQLKPDEIGFINVSSLKQNGVELRRETVGTVLEVELAKPIMPGEKVTFDMVFDAQIPVQIRRSGRHNKEGVAFTMSQWFPKLAEYDFEGWHAYEYIQREFHGVWGDYDVKISIDKDYIIGATGYLQNPNEIGYGYETASVKRPPGSRLTWHFKAPKVHDFAWAADPDYEHDTIQVPNGPILHFLYKKGLSAVYKKHWKRLQPIAVEHFQYFNQNLGPYPYKQYSIIQGGDRGMEYPMCTIVNAERTFGGLVGTVVHEIAHNWFQSVIANNEAKHEWMDEGFTDYISDLALDEINGENFDTSIEDAYKSYFELVGSGAEQPQTTHSDRYRFNFSYSAYSKGAVFLAQLGYIIGEEHLKQTLKTYYKEWAFKHPTPNDFIRVAEKTSGLELDWYLIDWTQTTNTIDYTVYKVDGRSISLGRIGLMPMPIDVRVTYSDDSVEDFYIPLRMMRGEKPSSATLLTDWAWSYPLYTFEANKDVKSVEIDPKQLMADIDRTNNKM
ncbi:MAG: M1 family metallopeptidase [Flavobacteriaceae bacterium]|nr:M1 family metallopeptidase [Flavobacteriaceae bacterium]